MTKQEAIKILKSKMDGSVDTSYKWTEAVRMAIEELEQEQERQEDIYECRNCLGEVHINYIYCPFCGIRMESEEE